MPEQETIKRARQDAAEGKSPSTQAGEFVREEIHHVREGKHGVRNSKQAIAIGLSKARKAGVKLPAPPKGTASEAKHTSRRGKPSARRSGATSAALRREGRSGASHRALSRQTRTASRSRTASSRSQAARKAAHTRTSRSASRS